MFSYFGSKSKIIDLYPTPTLDMIIEPFAGSARYALKYFEKDVLLVDAYDVVVKVWHFLQQASEKDILGLPEPKYLQSIDDFDLSEGERLLMGFMVGRGARRPGRKVHQYSDIHNDKKRIASSLYKVRHWKIIHGEYKTIPNQKATWFIDPPYQHIGRIGYNVQERGLVINYKHLAKWCESRKGEAIVCEITSADWLPFEPLKKRGKESRLRGLTLKTTEAIWCKGIQYPRQLSLFD